MARLLLLVAAVALVALNCIGDLMTSTGYANRWSMASHLVSYAVLAPALLASIFLIAKANRTFNRFLAAFCALSALVVISNVTSVVKEAAAPKPPRVVSAEDSKAELTIPANWRISENKSAKQSIYVVDRMAVSAVVVFSAPKAGTPDEFEHLVAEALQQQREAKFPLVSLTGPGTCPISNARCVSYEIRQSAHDTVVVQLMTFVDGRSDFYVISASTSANLLDQEREVLTSIVASFKERP